VKLIQPTPAYWEEQRKKAMAEFPGAKFGWPGDAKRPLLQAIKSALEVGSEEAIQKALTENPYLIQYAIDGSGHHGTWAFPKQMIRPRGADGTAGLIPDFLVVTQSSLGYFWHVVELKRFDVQFANRSGDGLSTEGNKAVAQCNNYLTHFQDYIDAIRSNIRIEELIQPKGAILLIGDSAKENKAQRQCRANFVRNSAKIEVVSYRRIINALGSDLGSRSA
jgi:hypothetical protein